MDILNLLSLVTVSVALSRPCAARAMACHGRKKEATNARQLGSYGNSLTGSEPGTEGRVQDGRDIIYRKSRRGRYGMVVHERFDSTAVPMVERTPVAPLYSQGRRFKATAIVVTTERYFQNSEPRVLAKEKKRKTKKRERRCDPLKSE